MPLSANRIVDRLPRSERLRLLGECERVDLDRAEVLHEAGEPLRHVHSPTAGFASLVSLVDGGPGLAIRLAGREGMVGAEAALGVVAAPLRAVVQGEGAALRLTTRAFVRQLERLPRLRRDVDRYLAVVPAQTATSVACARHHTIGPRLARWLLMIQDRSGGDRLLTTQESVAAMLGVRRVGITEAAGALPRAGVVRNHRGELVVLDRVRLLASACSCYAACERADATLMG